MATWKKIITSGSIAELAQITASVGLQAASADINGGTIDATDITVGSSKTLDVSAGTLTLNDDQISGDAIDGGTIGSTTINTLTNTTLTSTTIKDFTTVSGSITSTGSFGFLEASNILFELDDNGDIMPI